MTEVRPDGQAEIAERDGLVVLDEEGLAGSCLRGYQVLRGQDMGVSNVGHIGDIPQVEAVADEERRLPFIDACVDGRDQLVVAGAAEDGRPERTGGQRLAGCVEDQSLCGGL